MGHEQKDFKQASKGSAGLEASRHDEVPRRLSGHEGAHPHLLLHLVVSHERKKSKLASKATAGHEPSGSELHGAHNRDTICRAPNSGHGPSGPKESNRRLSFPCARDTIQRSESFPDITLHDTNGRAQIHCEVIWECSNDFSGTS